MNKNKREKPEDFIGWKSSDGNLEVIGIADDTVDNGRKLFKVRCKICSPDLELFPDGYFIARKSHLKEGKKPCGCSGKYEYDEQQWLVRSRRAAKKKGFVVHGIHGDFKNIKTKIKCECPIHSYEWFPCVNNIVNMEQGCIKCAGVYSPTEQEAINICIKACNAENYTFLKFPDGYRNSYSRFEYDCPKHGVQSAIYNDFINSNARCRKCYVDRQRENGHLRGKYLHRLADPDYLYILNFNNEYIKVGRTFSTKDRFNNLKSVSKCENMKVLSIFTDKHIAVWDLEQLIHKELRMKYLDIVPENWYSEETFSMESLPTVYDIISTANITQVDNI